MTPFEQGYRTLIKLAMNGDAVEEVSTASPRPGQPHPEPKKYTREDVNYVDSSLHEGEECQKCAHYQTDGTCGLVVGKISPNGYCDEFTPG